MKASIRFLFHKFVKKMARLCKKVILENGH